MDPRCEENVYIVLPDECGVMLASAAVSAILLPLDPRRSFRGGFKSIVRENVASFLRDGSILLHSTPTRIWCPFGGRRYAVQDSARGIGERAG